MRVYDFLEEVASNFLDFISEHLWLGWLLLGVIFIVIIGAVAYFGGHYITHIYTTWDWSKVPDLTTKQFEWSVLVLLFLNWLKSTSVTVQCKHKPCECVKK